MDIVTAIERSGGLASRATLIAASTRSDVDRALREATIVRAGHGRYTLPTVGIAAGIAHGANGVLCLTSAALHHGWEVKSAPDKPHVLFPRHRKVPEHWHDKLILHRGDLTVDDISNGATSREFTLTQCLRLLPDDEALIIADSALRNGEDATLRRAMALVRGRGQSKAQRIGKAARGESTNAFESATRAICNTVPGLHVEPQVVISSPTCWACPDLVDVDRKMVVECESFEWHSKRASLRKDVRRYSLLVADGWIVLRFIWEDVMFRPEWVRDVLMRTVGVDARTLVNTAWPFAA